MFYDQVKESADYIRERVPQDVDAALILGSGLGGIVDVFEDVQSIPYGEIPNFPVSTVEGHAGNLVFGRIGETKVMALQGRFHYYEGLTMKEVAYPVYVMKLLGIENLIITNACGGINEAFRPGDLMILDDFINSVSDNPLIGANDERFGPRFPDMSEPFSQSLRDQAEKAAQELGIKPQHGTYILFPGPCYETAAEIEMFRRAGADAVGMSTVPETIAANYMGIRTLGISCITNMATGIRTGKHSHEEVLSVAEQAGETLSAWMEQMLRDWNSIS